MSVPVLVWHLRPDAETHDRPLDGVFKETIDWDLIERHWPDLLQVMVSDSGGTRALLDDPAQAQPRESQEHALPSVS